MYFIMSSIAIVISTNIVRYRQLQPTACYCLQNNFTRIHKSQVFYTHRRQATVKNILLYTFTYTVLYALHCTFNSIGILSLCIHCTHDCAARIWHYILLLSFTVSIFFLYSVDDTYIVTFVNSRYCIYISILYIVTVKTSIALPTRLFVASCIYYVCLRCVMTAKKVPRPKNVFNLSFAIPTTPTICMYILYTCVIRTHG